MGESLVLVGCWEPSKALLYACLPASCSWTLEKPTVFLLAVLIYLKTQHPDSQNPKLPLRVRRVILIQCHLAHPSVWPWNPGICSLLLLGFVRWQAKTLMGKFDQLARTVTCVCTHPRVHMSLWLLPRAREKGQVLAQATVFVRVAGGGSSSSQKTCREPCAIPTGRSTVGDLQTH